MLGWIIKIGNGNQDNVRERQKSNNNNKKIFCVSAHSCNLLPTICCAIHILHHDIVFLKDYVFIKCVIKLFAPVNFDYELTSANFIVFSTPLVAKNFIHNTVLINQFRSLKFLCKFGNAIYLVKYHRSDISIEWQEKEYLDKGLYFYFEMINLFF